MALSDFIPKLWSARLLESLDKLHVYSGLVNRSYEGDIRGYGDTVKISSVGDVKITDYNRNQDMEAPDALDGSQVTLSINQAKKFNFQLEDIDRAQQNPKIMDEAMRRAGEGINDEVDKYIAGMYTEVASKNAIGSDESPIVPTKKDAYDYLVDMSVLLDEANVPSSGRWVVVPSWFHALLQKDDRFVTTQAAGFAEDVLRNGLVGEVTGLRVYKSNNIPNTEGAKYKIMAGHSVAITFASQISRIEAYRPEKRFADAIKGLYVYGAKVVIPSAISVLTVSKS